MVFDMVSQLSAKHPLRYKLKWIEGDTLERDDIWVIQIFPHNSLLAK
jgi:hypothetical protein